MQNKLSFCSICSAYAFRISDAREKLLLPSAVSMIVFSTVTDSFWKLLSIVTYWEHFCLVIRIWLGSILEWRHEKTKKWYFSSEVENFITSYSFYWNRWLDVVLRLMLRGTGTAIQRCSTKYKCSSKFHTI